MNALIEAIVNRPRPVLLVLAVLIIAGVASYITIPKEAEPDIVIPQLYINILHEGISPEDAERLLIRPMETELRSLEGLDEIRATASEGSAVLILEFDAGFDADQALSDVREKVDLARAELPSDTEEPFVQEVSVSMFPVLVVNLHGNVPERALLAIARQLRDEIETLPGVLDAAIGGEREELLEVIVDPIALETYGLAYEEIINYVTRNNRLVAAGVVDTGQGRFAVKIPGVFEGLEDLDTLPIKTDGQRTVTFGDVATVRRTFKDRTNYARLDGETTVALEITKRAGANILQLADMVEALVEQARELLPETVEITITQDRSEDVRIMLNDLINNVATAVILVMIVVLGALGLRSASLVGLSIPGAFLTGILAISLLGFSMNIVVLFSLIMAVGLLVDGAIVVVESAQVNLSHGYSPRRAYMEAAKRMAWPITASTATTLAAFMPLLFWPGMIGEFMVYLPITLLVTLAASLAMALLFVPTVGALSRSAGQSNPETQDSDVGRPVDLLAEGRDYLEEMKGFTAAYIAVVKHALKRPILVLTSTVAMLLGSFGLYWGLGLGYEFFPEIEPELAVLNVHARGDLSVDERNALVRQVESRILDMNEFDSIYTRAGTYLGNDIGEDVIGRIQIAFVDWERRRPAEVILAEIRERTADLAGIIIEPQTQDPGVTQGKPIQIELSSRNPELLPQGIARVRGAFDEIGDLIDVTDNAPVPGIEWTLTVDREEAARFGADIATIGSAVQLVTNGIMIGDYRPDDADDEVDIRVRFPSEKRNIAELEELMVNTRLGSIPIRNFVVRTAEPRVGNLHRTNGVRTLTIQADKEDDVLTDTKVSELQAYFAGAADWDPSIGIAYKGETEDQAEAEEFLTRAFTAALFLMAIILVAQFNSFYQALLILTAVVFSTVGVLLGLIVTNQPFGIVMSGIGVISLAGIVVNNNIVLIDTFNRLRDAGAEAFEAAVLTCSQRLRPVMLTTVTTILGLMPMVLGMNIDLINRHVEIGGPSTQWWTQLATAIAGGLAFATVLTLIVTPSLLVLGDRLSSRRAATPE
ncbi:MAG TPA: efflux RND transporter permease subunit [Gammaproteobacteria bacterium]|jgi:multidrug efflux pump